jgi:hypothetical protein
MMDARRHAGQTRDDIVDDEEPSLSRLGLAARLERSAFDGAAILTICASAADAPVRTGDTATA